MRLSSGVRTAAQGLHGAGTLAMNRRTRIALIVGGLAVATAVATVVVLPMALARVLDPHHLCETGFSTLVSCTLRSTSTSTYQSTPSFAAPPPATSPAPA